MAPSGKPIGRTVAALLGAVCLLNVLVLPAGAQEADRCYPDGCTPPSNPRPSDEVKCKINRSSAEVGGSVRGTVSVLDRHDLVEIRFDGQTVAFRDVASVGSNSGQWSFTFTVPQRQPGEYSVVAVGVDFSVSCTTANGDASFEVLGEKRGGGGKDKKAGSTSEGSERGGRVVAQERAVAAGSDGILPFSGAQTALLVVLVAVALIGGTTRRRLRSSR